MRENRVFYQTYNFIIMKRLFHICISSPNEVMFRDEEDYNAGVNLLALSLFKTGTSILADALMSNHIHLAVQTEAVSAFVKSFRVSYNRFFNEKYKRTGALGNPNFFCFELRGIKHILTGISYIYRNGLHHGQSDSAFGYEHSSVNCIFKKSLGKKECQNLMTSRIEIKKFLPRFAEFPDHFIMDSNGTFIRDSFIEVKQVELLYSTPRSFLFYMNRLTGEDWIKEQKIDGENEPPITLNVIESESDETEINEMIKNETGRQYDPGKNDIEVCKLIDKVLVKRLGKESIYQLSSSEKKRIALDLSTKYYINEKAIKRCLA